MTVENRKESVPFAHYVQRFSRMNPEKAAGRLGIRWDGKEFYVNLLGKELAISHPGYAIRSIAGGEIPSVTAQTLLLRYLLESHDAAWLGTWKTFREMPWGETYWKSFSGRILSRAAFAFGGRLEAFRAAAEKMGAEPVPHGDAGYCFPLLGSCRMQLLLWEGDEDFPPSAQILYSDNCGAAFTAEDRVVAAELLIGAIRNHM